VIIIKNETKLDKNDLTQKFDTSELKEYLSSVIDTEMQKPTNQMDADLISECVDWALEIDGRELQLPDETVRIITKEIVAKHYRPKRKLFNVLTIIAACLMLVLSIQIVSMTVFHENLFQDAYEGVEYIIHRYILHDDFIHS
jgi:hypothetical protein